MYKTTTATFHMPDGTQQQCSVVTYGEAWMPVGSADLLWRADRVVLQDGTVIKDRFQ